MLSAENEKRLVLVVEDDVPLQKLFGHLLRYEGFNVVTASTKREAEQFVERMPGISLIVVSDYSLPDGNGLELREWMRLQNAEPEVFLLVSGMFDRTPIPGLPFLAKPFPPAELGRTIKRLLAEKTASVDDEQKTEKQA